MSGLDAAQGDNAVANTLDDLSPNVPPIQK